MGSNQSNSNDGARTITVETDEGDVDVKLTEDFIKHVTGTERTSRNDRSSSETTTDASTTEPFIPRAEEILLPGYTPPPSTHQDGKWRRLYEEEKHKNDSLNKISQEEFERAANEVTEEFRHSELGKLVPLCDENRQEVLQCYHDNSNRTLLCSDVVYKYIQCVQNARKSVLVQTLNKN